MPNMFNGTEEEFEKWKKEMEEKQANLPDWQQRLLEEYKELDKKSAKLYSFIMSDEFIGLSKLEKFMLENQYTAMSSYLKYLGYRLDFYHIEH